MYAQNEFSKTQANTKREKQDGLITLAIAIPLIIGCIALAVRCIH